MYSLAAELAVDRHRSLLAEADNARQGASLAKARRLRHRADRADQRSRRAAAHLN